MTNFLKAAIALPVAALLTAALLTGLSGCPGIVPDAGDYTVTFDPQGGSSVEAQAVTSGGTAAEPSPAPVKTGYIFGGWYKDAGGTEPWDFNTGVITAHITLYAKWTQKPADEAGAEALRDAGKITIPAGEDGADGAEISFGPDNTVTIKIGEESAEYPCVITEDAIIITKDGEEISIGYTITDDGKLNISGGLDKIDESLPGGAVEPSTENEVVKPDDSGEKPEDKDDTEKPEDKDDEKDDAEKPEDKDDTEKPSENTYSISLRKGNDVLSSHTFPSASVGYAQQSSLAFTVRNTGENDTGQLDVVLSGTDGGGFELSTSKIDDIEAGDTYTVTVRPKTGLTVDYSEKTYTATVTVKGEHGLTAGFTVSFTVTTEPVYSISHNVSSNSHTFPLEGPGYAALEPLSVTVANTGNRHTGTLTVALSGTNSDAYTLSVAAIGPVDMGKSAAFTVAPKTGLAEDSYTAKVTISGENGLEESFAVNFTVSNSGTGSVTIKLPVFTDAGAGLGTDAEYTVYRTESPKEVTITLTGTQAGDKIRWVESTKVRGTGESITLKASAYTPGNYYFSVELERGGGFWSKEFTLAVLDAAQ
jgi:uncharacterized repeat protein (TIGR02543 family)